MIGAESTPATRRTRTLKIRLSQTEFDVARTNAQERNIDLATYARSLILNCNDRKSHGTSAAESARVIKATMHAEAILSFQQTLLGLARVSKHGVPNWNEIQQVLHALEVGMRN